MVMEGDKCLGNKHILGYGFWREYKLVLDEAEFGIVHALFAIFPNSERLEALNTLNIFGLRVTGQVARKSSRPKLCRPKQEYAEPHNSPFRATKL